MSGFQVNCQQFFHLFKNQSIRECLSHIHIVRSRVFVCINEMRESAERCYSEKVGGNVEKVTDRRRFPNNQFLASCAWTNFCGNSCRIACRALHWSHKIFNDLTTIFSSSIIDPHICKHFKTCKNVSQLV